MVRSRSLKLSNSQSRAHNLLIALELANQSRQYFLTISKPTIGLLPANEVLTTHLSFSVQNYFRHMRKIG